MKKRQTKKRKTKKQATLQSKSTSSKNVIIAAIALIIISFIISIYFYNLFPEKIASHWNTSGEVDSYMSKGIGLFLFPIVSLAILLLFLFIPLIDPLKKNIVKFRKYFDWFILLIIFFLFYIYLLTIFWNLGYEFNMNLALIPALGFLFYFIGILIEKSKRNWFVGIRTPWTLSSDKVWDKTHKLGGKLFKISGIIAIIGIFFEKYIIWFVLIPVLISVVWTFVYSYVEYRKLKK